MSQTEREEKDKKNKSKFTDACYIMDYIGDISAVAIKNNPNGYKSFKTIECDPEKGAGAYEIVAKLTSGDGLQYFLNAPPAALAALQPKIRLYKLVYGSEDSKNPIAEPEFIFDDYYSRHNIDSLFAGNNLRVGAVGLKDVNWKLNGTNPAEANKIIEVSLSFEFQTASDLLGNRQEANGTIGAGLESDDMEANMIDLILHPPSFEESQGAKAALKQSQGNYVPKFYRIRMDIGWAKPQLSENKLPGMELDETEQMIKDLERQEMSLILNLVEHSFEINENGKIGLSVEYVGALEESINGNDADILALISKRSNTESTQKSKMDIEDKKAKIADLGEYIECMRLSEKPEDSIEPFKEASENLAEEIKEAQKDLEEIMTENKSAVYSQLLTNINENVYSIEVSEGEIEDWLESIANESYRPSIKEKLENAEKAEPTNADDALEATKLGNDDGALATLGRAVGLTNSSEENADEVIKKAKKDQQDADKGYIEFIFLGDIMDAACQALSPAINPSAGASTIICGPIVINHPRGHRYSMNLADLPISYADFQQFFFEVVVRKQLSNYPLKQFIRDIMERLVKKTLQPSECFKKGREQRTIDIAMTNFTITKSMATKYAIEPNYLFPTGRLNVNDIFTESGFIGEKEEVVDCIFLYMNSYKASELTGIEDEDMARGIYHFYIGSDVGIVKGIDYKKSDVQGLREARQAEARNLGQIRDVYNASVKLVGNSLFRPGMKVFLHPPLGFGDPTADGYDPVNGRQDPNNFGSISNLLGIGGYYDVITVDSTISTGGQYETTLECVFAQSGGQRDSVEAKCEGILERPPEIPKSMVDGAFEKVGSIISSVLGG